MKNNKKIIISLFFSFIMLIGAFAVMTSGNSNNITLPVNNIPATANRTNPVNYGIELSGVPSGTGTYQQLITINNPANYDINSNGSNIQFVAPNGTILYAWIQNINSTSMQVWVKNYNGSSVIDMQVFPSFENLFSANGYLGEAPQLSSTYGEYDNLMKVFDTSLISQNITYTGQGMYGSSDLIGYIFIISSIHSYNNIQLQNSSNDYNPQIRNNSNYANFGIYTGSSTGQTNLSIPVTQLNFVSIVGLKNSNGYDWVYQANTVTGNYQYNVFNNGDYWFIDGGGNNVSLRYLIGIDAPNGEMPTYTINLLYTVNITESGLSANTSWTFTFNGNTETLTNTSYTFLVTNGTYSLHVNSVKGYSSVYNNSVVVNGANVTQNTVFMLLYTVNITQSGLSANTSWTFTFNGNTETLTNTSYTFLVTNGTYFLHVNSVKGYIDTYNSIITVNGANVSHNIVFNFTYSINIIINNPDKAFYEITINENNNITHYNLTSSLITIHVINKNFPVTISINNLKKGYAISNPIISYDIAGNYSINEKIINTNNANNLVNNYTPYIIIVLILTALMIIGLIIKRGRE